MIDRPRCHASVPSAVASALVLFACASIGTAQALPVEFEQRFDQIVLTTAQGGVAVRVFPLGLSVDEEPNRAQPLRVRVLDYPDRQYDVAWRDIERVEFFEDVLLGEVRKATKAGKYEDAYRLLAFVWKTEPQWRGLTETTEAFLMQDAVGAFRKQQFEESLVVLDELFGRNAKNKNVANAILRVTDRMFDESLRRRDYRAARHIISWVTSRTALGADVEIGGWQESISAIAGAHLTTARAELESKNYRAALDAIDRALRVWPSDRRASELAQEILQQYPRVAVGVSRIGNAALDYHYDWATRRTNRLVGRSLLELEDYGANGGDYSFPLGKLTVDEDEQGAWLVPSRAYQPSAAGIAQFVENLACEGQLPCQPMLHRLLQSVQIEPNRGVHLRLERQSLRWLPLLDVPLGTTVGPRMAAYKRQDHASPAETIFLANDHYDWHERGRPTEVFERLYDSSADMVLALEQGDVDLIDRISPADASRLRGAAGITVGAYAFPSAYFLVPNLHKRLMKDRTFRRAIVYGIHRDSILNNVLLGGQSCAGCQVITGPFPAATGRRDAMDYAYDTDIQRRSFDPELAAALAAMARHREMMRALDDPDELPPAAETETDSGAPSAENVDAKSSPPEPLLLVHPRDAMLAQSAAAIARSLTLAGIACRAQPLPLGQTRPQDEHAWDLWIIDVTFQEPIVDIHRLFGPSGLLAEPSTYVVQALEDLSRTTRWTDARAALREVHDLVHAELSVIPLWQLTNHFAYSDRLSGVAAQPHALYQNIERWRISR